MNDSTKTKQECSNEEDDRLEGEANQRKRSREDRAKARSCLKMSVEKRHLTSVSRFFYVGC